MMSESSRFLLRPKEVDPDLKLVRNGQIQINRFALAVGHPVGGQHLPRRRLRVTEFGAAGDGPTVDSPAIDTAIEAAASAGGDVVEFSAGDYLNYFLRWRSHITLHFGLGTRWIPAELHLYPVGGQVFDPRLPAPSVSPQPHRAASWLQTSGGLPSLEPKQP